MNPGEKMEQEWIRIESKAHCFEFSGEEVQVSGEAWLGTTLSLSEAMPSLNDWSTQREDLRSAKKDLQATRPDPTVQVISFHYLISLIIFYY